MCGGGLHHSNALLLPDATVLVTGGGAAARDRITSMERSAQIHSPSCPFTAGGQRASRPSLTAAPTWLEIGQTFGIQTKGANSISRVVLLKTGSATHNWNMEQRFMDLAFSGSGNAWTVSNPVLLALASAPVPVASVSGAAAIFSAVASGSGVQYQWNFGDGSADTAWSATGTVGHTYAAPGSHVVTLRVRSTTTGDLISRSFLQTVYLPATATAPGASANRLVEAPASGNPRLWVVNQDNDSVTAFDAVTRARLGEVAVGADPRSIARAANGLL